MENFLERHKQLKRTQEETKNIGTPNIIRKIQSVIKNLTTKNEKPRTKELHWSILASISEELTLTLQKSSNNANNEQNKNQRGGNTSQLIL